MKSERPILRSVAAPKPTSSVAQEHARASKAETNHNSITQDDASPASGSQANVALRQLAKLLGHQLARQTSGQGGGDD